jgi:hypothetical protein
MPEGQASQTCAYAASAMWAKMVGQVGVEPTLVAAFETVAYANSATGPLETYRNPAAFRSFFEAERFSA